MFKPTTFPQAIAIALTACILTACGGENSTSNNDLSATEEIKYKLSLTPVEAGNAGIIGKSIYTIKVTDLDGNAVYGETPTIKPMMNMTGGMIHSAPNLGCTESDDNGDSNCTIYFPMASSMGDIIMGSWVVDIALASAETLSFNPAVTMPMSETPKAVLKANNDTINGLPRNYLIFNNTQSSMVMPMMATTRSVELFIASKESMMSFPTLATNTVLNKDTADELSVETITVLVSANKDADDDEWVEATSTKEGIWNADITAYTDTFYVKLSVNGFEKMSGDMNYASFLKMTPMTSMGI